jgi:hypothetical protein
MMPLLVLWLAAGVNPALPDLDGKLVQPLRAGKWSALFFVTSDCPLSNNYAGEIQRTCDEYSKRGVVCTLVYVDIKMGADEARRHAAEYGHGGYGKVIDRKHVLVKAAGAKVTPEAALFDTAGQLLYRGRIDDSYLVPGQSRRKVSQPDLRNALDAAIAGRPIAVRETRAVGCAITEPELRR